MQLEQEVTCVLPGMEHVKVTYNLMASAKQIDLFRAEFNTDTAKAVIVKVVGLDDPFSDEQPIAWSLWLRWHGLRAALEQFLLNPN